MNIFLSITDVGISRAERNGAVGWRVESMLDGQEIICLTNDPLQAGVIYAGTRICRVEQWRCVALAGSR